MNKERVKNVQNQIRGSKKQAEGVIIAQDRIQQNMESAGHYIKKQDAKKEKIKEKDAENYNSQTWLAQRTPDADRALLDAIAAGKVGAFELFYKLMDRLKDKTEMELRVGHTADERIQIAREIARELQEFNQGTDRGGEVPSESILLSENIRHDK